MHLFTLVDYAKKATAITLTLMLILRGKKRHWFFSNIDMVNLVGEIVWFEKKNLSWRLKKQLP